MADEFMCNTSEVRSFIGAVKEIVSGTARSRHDWRPSAPFQSDDADPDWLPAEFRRIPEAGGWAKGSRTGFCTGIRRGLFPCAPWCCPPVLPHLSTITWHGGWWVIRGRTG